MEQSSIRVWAAGIDINFRKTYCLNDRDLVGLCFEAAPNPRNPLWHPMKLYLRFQVAVVHRPCSCFLQVEETAVSKHGNLPTAVALAIERQAKLDALNERKQHCAIV